MDQVLKGSEAALCPFQTFQESVRQFAQAIYQLRLAGGRCTAPGTPAGCGLYDPNSLHFDPPVSAITYRGGQIAFEAADQPYPRGIRSSFGIDFVDVVLDPRTQGQPLTIEFSGARGGDAEFGDEIWKLMGSGSPGGSQTDRLQIVSSAQLTRKASDGHMIYTISEIDTGESNRPVLGSIADSGRTAEAGGTGQVVYQGSFRHRHSGLADSVWSA